MALLLLSFLFGVLITVGKADKCCKFYVSPPSTVLVQLKNHNIVGAVPRQSPPSHYSSHLIPQNTAPNNYFMVNYHANGNPNYVYHTTPPQNNMQNGMYGIQQASYAAPAWQQSYYQAPGYLPATVLPQASYAVQQNETKKEASYFVSSAYFSNSTEINENGSDQNVSVKSQHQLGDHLRNAEHSAVTSDASKDQADLEYTEPTFPIVTSSLSTSGFATKGKESPMTSPSSSQYNLQSTQATVPPTSYLETARDVNPVASTKQQSIKPSPTSSPSSTTNAETSSQHTTILPNGTLLNKSNKQNTIANAKNDIEIQRQIDNSNTSIQKLDTSSSNTLTNNSEDSLHSTTIVAKSQTSEGSVKTTPTSSTQESGKSNNSSKVKTSSSTKTTSSESNSTLSTTTVFTVIPVHRDAQRYGNNPYDDQNSVDKLNAHSITLFLSVIAYSILILIR